MTVAQELMAISPIDGRYASKISDFREIFSEFGLIKARIEVEVTWCQQLFSHPSVPTGPKLSESALTALDNFAENFSIDDAIRVKTIEATTSHDVKACEYWLSEQFKNNKELAGLTHWIHFACTSEDINNLAYGLMLKAGTTSLAKGLDHLIAQLDTKANEYADIAMLARTHGQTASPTTLGKECQNIVQRLRKSRAELLDAPIYGKLNGAVGNFNAHIVALPDVNWPELSEQLVAKLGLTFNAHTTQIEPHDGLATLLHALNRINTITIDASRDFWQYISLGYFKQSLVAGEVGSSTMPHKVNPIDFENAEGNLGIANALGSHLAEKLPISRLQRDLSDSTVLRNLGVVFAHTQLAWQSFGRGLNKCVVDVDKIASDLDGRWEVLGEAVQTVMRAHGIADAYEQLKAFTRGKAIDQTSLQAFIAQLTIPEADKARLTALTPATYIGLAGVLAQTGG